MFRKKPGDTRKTAINPHQLFVDNSLRLADILRNYFGQNDLAQIDGRTMAAAFKRFHILERYLKRESWRGENP
nr:hypothetical protein [uncultured Acetatifactor sp.]